MVEIPTLKLEILTYKLVKSTLKLAKSTLELGILRPKLENPTLQLEISGLK